MAWWDNEELKAPDDRSEKYKLAFPKEYENSEKMERMFKPDTAKNDINKPAFIAVRKDNSETPLMIYSVEELLILSTSDKQNEWKFYRVGDEVEVKTSIVPVSKTRKLTR